MTEDNKQDTSFPSGGSRRIHRSQSHRGTETVHPPPCRRVRHDRQQLRAGKSFQLQAESEADGKAGGGHGDPYRMPQRPRELHVRAPWHEPRKAQTDV